MAMQTLISFGTPTHQYYVGRCDNGRYWMTKIIRADGTSIKERINSEDYELLRASFEEKAESVFSANNKRSDVYVRTRRDPAYRHYGD